MCSVCNTFKNSLRKKWKSYGNDTSYILVILTPKDFHSNLLVTKRDQTGYALQRRSYCISILITF